MGSLRIPLLDKITGKLPTTVLPDLSGTYARAASVGSLGTEGLALWGYGNSYLANTGNAFMTFFDRVRRRGRFGAWWNAGVSGYLMPDICQRAYGTFTAPSQGSLDLAPASPPNIAGTWAAAPLKGGVVLLEPFRNDASFDGITTSGSTTTKARAAATQALKAFICLMRAQSRIEDEDASNTYTGTWATIGSLTNVSNTAVHYTSTVGSKVSRSITVPASGEIDVIMLAIDDFAMTTSGGQGGAPYKITCTGQADILGTTSNQHRITGHGPNSNYSTMVERITGLTPGASVTVTLEKTGAADGTILWFDGFLLGSATPPTVAVLKPGTLTSAQYATIAAGGGTGASPATDAIYAGIVDTVVAQFPADSSVVALDPNAAGFNATTMISNADGLNVHLNDLGNACYADLILAKLNSLPARLGLQASASTTPATLPDVQRVASAEKGVAGGVATLDSSALVPLAQLPTGQKAKGFTAPSTYWQLPCNQMGAGTATAVTSGNLTFVPVDVGPAATAYAALGVGVSATVQVAGTTTTTLAVYPDDGTGARPQCAGGPIASGTVTLTAANNRTVAISTTLQPGRYWLAFLYVESVAPTTKAQVYMITNAVTGPIASSSVIGNIVGRGWLITGATVMPTTDVRSSMTSIGGTQAPIVALQAA